MGQLAGSSRSFSRAGLCWAPLGGRPEPLGALRSDFSWPFSQGCTSRAPAVCCVASGWPASTRTAPLCSVCPTPASRIRPGGARPCPGAPACRVPAGTLQRPGAVRPAQAPDLSPRGLYDPTPVRGSFLGPQTGLLLPTASDPGPVSSAHRAELRRVVLDSGQVRSDFSPRRSRLRGRCPARSRAGGQRPASCVSRRDGGLSSRCRLRPERALGAEGAPAVGGLRVLGGDLNQRPLPQREQEGGHLGWHSPQPAPGPPARPQHRHQGCLQAPALLPAAGTGSAQQGEGQRTRTGSAQALQTVQLP